MSKKAIPKSRDYLKRLYICKRKKRKMYDGKNKKDKYAEIIEKTARDLNLDPRLVEEIVESQRLFTINEIKRGNMNTIKLLYLGKFICYPMVYFIKKGIADKSLKKGDISFLKYLVKQKLSVKKQLTEIARFENDNL